MLWRLTLAVAVVYVGGICSCVRADVMSRLIVPRDYGVKLCGREFIRAVIFTCGGSRWKRSTEGDLDSFQWNSLSDVTVEDNQHTWQSGIELPDNRSPPHVASSRSLADLLALYGAMGEWRQPQSLSDPAPLEKTPQLSTVLAEQDGSSQAAAVAAADWPIPSKKKRNFSLGVAGMCCNQGCTKNDIGRLC